MITVQVLAAWLILIPGGQSAPGWESGLRTTPLIETNLYRPALVRQKIINRIEDGAYDGYTVDLCIDDPSRCEGEAFEPYKKVVNGEVSYSLQLEDGVWDDLPSPVRQAVIREILYNTWGHSRREYSPVSVSFGGDLDLSPLFFLNPKSSDLYLNFSRPEYLLGGQGQNAYGPNCWYTSISSIADDKSLYARSTGLAAASWDQPRFMGPTEFRAHMEQFDQVEEPRFGDILRYYTEETIYEGMIFGGEVHAAVYIGEETYSDKEGRVQVREIALTKNGRSDLDFLIYQDIAGLDEIYLGGDTRIQKNYFRVVPGAKLLNPATDGRVSYQHSAYLIDMRNYTDRWLCLAGVIPPPQGDNTTCYSYPLEWMVIPTSSTEHAERTKEPHEDNNQLFLDPVEEPVGLFLQEKPLESSG